MADLVNEMLEAIIIETVDTIPEELLAYYRNPPGRKPHEHVCQIQTAIADMDDATATMIIRDIVDRVVFSMLYLIEAEFKNIRIKTTISRGAQSDNLTNYGLHEDYRELINPGGTHSQI